jgi:predicted lipoprotein with Yx(FWY)xxD motif
MRFRRTATTLATTAALVAPAAMAQATPSRSAVAARAATVKIAHTSAGNILETGSGLTVYRFTKDSRNHDRCATTSGCLSVWPMVTVTGKPVAGAGVKSKLLGTITVHGKKQVTYAGHPLYLYAEGDGKGETDYLGYPSFGGHWDGVTANGGAVS